MIRIITNIQSYGPEPAEGAEIEQRLTIRADGQCWLTRYAYQRGGDPVCVKRERFQAKSIDTLLFEMKAFFDSYDWGLYNVTDTGVWTIEADGQEASLMGLVNFGRVTGSVCGVGSAESTSIRTALGRNDLFLLDGGSE
ncbi:MAG: hypothetical protein IJ089_13995 [Clostridia bacterium]|nr:hypothetical protein [Clostridia bacterium]MBQ8964877.1 hypothetical protein [Clostridia bacterium]